MTSALSLSPWRTAELVQRSEETRVSAHSIAGAPYARELERLERSDPTLELRSAITEPRGSELPGGVMAALLHIAERALAA